MSRILRYINPIARLGYQKYSIFLPLVVTLAACAILELIAYGVLHDPLAIGVYAIFVFVALIIYFSFRDGIGGGLITTAITVGYYFYIIYTRTYSGEQLSSSIETTLVLAALYIFLSFVIGGLKQKIDTLIEREADERRRLQSILQQMPMGVIVTDKNGVVEISNKQADVILGRTVPVGYKTGDMPIVEGTVDGKKLDGSHSLSRQTLISGKPIVNKEYEIDRGGHTGYIQASASVIHNARGKIVAAVTIFSDITAHRELEKRKDDFVNMASHELKTPITSMKLYVDVLGSDVKKHKDDKMKQLVTSISYQTNRLQKLVSDLLDVSRLQTGKLSFTKDVFRIDELLMETVAELKRVADTKKITYTARMPLTVTADKFRIYQVLTNLITNAIKYSPDNPNIVVSAKKSGKNALISVQDFGIGIDKTQLKKIFERLYQVNDDKGKTFPGFGMGLYISREIVKRHRGRIWVTSQKGRGSTFYFTLPLHKAV